MPTVIASPTSGCGKAFDNHMDYATRYLGQFVQVKIDRPLGTKHPRHGFWYCLNYGFIPGTAAPDGEELDAYAYAYALIGIKYTYTLYYKKHTFQCLWCSQRLYV